MTVSPRYSLLLAIHKSILSIKGYISGISGQLPLHNADRLNIHGQFQLIEWSASSKKSVSFQPHASSLMQIQLCRSAIHYNAKPGLWNCSWISFPASSQEIAPNLLPVLSTRTRCVSFGRVGFERTKSQSKHSGSSSTASDYKGAHNLSAGGIAFSLVNKRYSDRHSHGSIGNRETLEGWIGWANCDWYQAGLYQIILIVAIEGEFNWAPRLEMMAKTAHDRKQRSRKSKRIKANSQDETCWWISRRKEAEEDEEYTRKSRFGRRLMPTLHFNQI